MAKSIRILFVEDNPDDVELVLRLLRKEGYDPTYRRVDTDLDLRVALLQELWDLVLCDWSMPGFSAPIALEVVKTSQRDVPFVILSGTVGEETAVAAMQSGADDFLVKDHLTRLCPVIERELAESANRREQHRVETELRRRETILATLGEIAGRLVRAEEVDAAIRDVLSRIGQAAEADRAFLYRNRQPTPDGPVLSSLAYEWLGRLARPRMEDPALQGMAWEEMGMARGVAALQRGETAHIIAKDLDEPLRTITYDFGVRSFVLVPIYLDGQWWGTLGLADVDEDRRWAEAEVSALRTVASTIGAAIERGDLLERIRRSHTELLEAYDRTLEGWSRALELRDRETEGHSRRVTDLTMKIARRMNIQGEELANIRRGALLHDIGKMGIPDAILSKPGPLTEEEWQVMRLHPLFAYDLLASIPYLANAIHIPYCHHERWDGTGYPRGLKAEEIPLAARIFAVADVWDAMRSDRPYSPAKPVDIVLATIENEAGKGFDPAVVQAFLDVIGVRLARSGSRHESGAVRR
ncbi:MAG: HD domain-containing phosphohydrolase [Gemmatimonadota bacterium]